MPDLFTEVSPDHGVERGLWARRVVVAAFAALAALAAWGWVGQRDSERTAAGATAAMTVSAPDTVRGGLYFQATIDITAREAIEHPRLVLDEGWLEGMQVNSIEPAAESESSRDGRLVLSYGGLEPADRLKVWLQFQVDPTNPGVRPHGVELDDAERTLVRIDRELRVLP